MKRSEKQKNLMRSAIAPTIVATIIFFITYFFFGMENTMIGPFATLSFLRYRNMCQSLRMSNPELYRLHDHGSIFLSCRHQPSALHSDQCGGTVLAGLSADRRIQSEQLFSGRHGPDLFPDCTSAYLFSTWKSFTCPAGKLRHCIFIFLASFPQGKYAKTLNWIDSGRL